MAGGIYAGYIRSFRGGYATSDWSFGVELIFVVILIGIIFMLARIDMERLKVNWRLICWLAACVLMFHFPPAIARLGWGFEWFVSRARYRYIPCIPAAGLVATVILTFEPRPLSWRVANAGAWLLGLFVLFANVVEIRNHQRYSHLQSNKFQRIVNVFLGDLNGLVKTGECVQILDRPFSDARSEYAGWNVKPEDILRVYGESGMFSRVSFLYEARDEETQDKCLECEVEKGSGH